MNDDNILIRRETPRDHRAVEDLVREAFWNVYRPGCLEHYVLHRFREDPAFVPELDLVMERDGELIGQNMFMRAVICADDGRRIPGSGDWTLYAGFGAPDARTQELTGRKPVSVQIP